MAIARHWENAKAEGRTTVKCEGCGRRLTADQLYWPQADIPQLLASGECFRWSLDWADRVTINVVYSTVCSPACLKQATAMKAEALRDILQAQVDEDRSPRVLFDGLRRKPRKSRRPSSKFTRKIRLVCKEKR